VGVRLKKGPPGRRVWCDASLVATECLVTRADGTATLLRLPGGMEVTGEGDYDVVIKVEFGPHFEVVVEDFTVFKRPDGRPVTASGLRDVPLGEYVEYLKAHPSPVAVPMRRQGDEWVSVRHRPAIRLPIDRGVPLPPQRGRRKDPSSERAELERAARIYREAPSGQRIATVMATMHWSKTWTKKRVRRARDVGLLEPSTRSGPTR
jgi:hypothetical protein